MRPTKLSKKPLSEKYSKKAPKAGSKTAKMLFRAQIFLSWL
jgi:hypothetical protein